MNRPIPHQVEEAVHTAFGTSTSMLCRAGPDEYLEVAFAQLTLGLQVGGTAVPNQACYVALQLQQAAIPQWVSIAQLFGHGQSRTIMWTEFVGPPDQFAESATATASELMGPAVNHREVVGPFVFDAGSALRCRSGHTLANLVSGVSVVYRKIPFDAPEVAEPLAFPAPVRRWGIPGVKI